MKAEILSLVVSFGAVALPSCASRPSPPSRPVSTADNSTSAALHADVNRYRAGIGKPALPRHPGLDRLAQDHSEFLRANRGKFKLSKTGNVSHHGFEARSLHAREKYNIWNLHENIAFGSRGTSITSVWARSKAHEANMRETWTYTGVGVAVDSDGSIFATQLFGSPDLSSHMRLRDRFGGF